MPSLSQVTVAAALLSLGLAAPVEKTSVAKRSAPFKVPQVANPNFRGRNGKTALEQARAKFAYLREDNGKVVEDINPSSVVANPQPNDEEYLEAVTIGKQQFTLDFDTGSSDLWVFGKGVSGRNTVYSPKGTAKKGEAWTISYGDGSAASGKVYSDTVTVGDTTVTGQAVEAATSASSEFTSGVEDGLLGLAFSSINTVTTSGRATPQNTFFDNAIAQGLNAVFAANLVAGAPGSYDFGELDSSSYQGDIAYTDVDSSQGFWTFTPDQGDSGIADTGTTLLLLPDATVDNYYGQVEGATNSQSDGGYIFPCDAQLPDFSITVAGYTATVPGSYINFATAEGSNCFGGLQSSSGIGINIYGDVFLKSQYVVFDKTQGSDSPRIGFAAKA